MEWSEVKDLLAEEIETFIDKGGQVLTVDENITKKIPVTVYSETTPNPSVMKFVASKMLTKTMVECKNIDETAASPLAKELFKFPFVKEVFIDENYVSISKYDIAEWMEITQDIRSFIKTYIEEGKTVIDESQIVKTTQHETQQEAYFDKLDATSQQIINILEEYVKPAVQSDGGNIMSSRSTKPKNA